MLVSFAIFHKGGLILFQHIADEERSTTSTGGESSVTNSINTWLADIYLNPTISKQNHKNYIDSHSGPQRTVVEWEEISELIAVAIYPDLRHEVDFPWISLLLKSMLNEYQLFIQASSDKENASSLNTKYDKYMKASSLENQSLFSKTFQILFQQHRNNATGVVKSSSTNAIKSNTTKTNTSGKEKRLWHDGKAKVTKEAMAELDRSKAVTDDEIQQSELQALAEARAAYLPTDTDLQDFHIEDTTTLIDDDGNEEAATWGDSLKGLFEQMTGQKVLTKQDLDLPLREMHKLLTSKNVASDIATQICDKVQESLVGKKLNSMYRVKTGVRQALEQVINQLLQPSTQLDLLRQVVSKRDQSSSFFTRSKTQRPYVIVVVGINGVGKSTSLAKLAYYLKTNGCKPLLAACDTFRSGAVEQLSVHAKCLDVPIYSKGYSKDPSSVAKAAIEQATQDGNDVVLVDTAGKLLNIRIEVWYNIRISCFTYLIHSLCSTHYILSTPQGECKITCHL
jgi:signal recognition particle GTPase